MRQPEKPRIAVTMGDPAGVGPELCLGILNDRRVLAACIPVVFGDMRILCNVARAAGQKQPARSVALAQWKAGADIPNAAVVDCGIPGTVRVRPGLVSAVCGKAAYVYIREAVNAAKAGRVRALATAPINKEALNLAGIAFPGHTEILSRMTKTSRYCMMLTSEKITVSLVTTHIALADVPASLSVRRILEVIELTAGAMRRIRPRAPRLLVCALNPHSGEHGLFGKEERRFIEPAVAAARRKGIRCEGPVPPDTAFLPERRRVTDAYVCMYHDQGLIPFKMQSFDVGVNVTLGLPIVRTSVDHGTAFDIAWQGRASRSSLVQAILLAVKLSSHRHMERLSGQITCE